MESTDTYTPEAGLQRACLLYGSEAMEALGRSRVLIFGVGGVGSWCAEALVRSGVGHLTMVDADDVDPSNLNRQLPATALTVGEPKVEVLCRRFREIRPDADIHGIKAFYKAENAADFDLEGYDVVIDAIDSVASKADLILRVCSLRHTRLISSMGAAQRRDPGKVAVAEFMKVKGCALARALRQRFRRAGTAPARKFRCVYSEETPGGLPKGTSMAVTATFGLRLAALAVDIITAKPENQIRE